ncbi:hypothetical protein Peur_006305 [Populus x canadensis]
MVLPPSFFIDEMKASADPIKNDVHACNSGSLSIAIAGNQRYVYLVRLLIEDPFEQPENTARAVSAGNLVKISEAIQTTYLKLVLVNQNRFSVLEALVRPRISRFIAGTPAGNSSNTGGHRVRAPVGNSSYTAGQHLMTRSQISRSVYSQSQAQLQTIQHKTGKPSQQFEHAKKGKSSKQFDRAKAFATIPQSRTAKVEA